jgi:outer membrane receptor protein involved in Fe transport
VHATDVLTLQTHWSWNTRGRFFRPDSASTTARLARPQLHVAAASGATAVMHDEAPGERVPAVADYSGRAGLTLRPRDGLSLNTWVTVMGPYVPLGEPTAETDPYVIGNFRASVRLNEAIELSGGIDNLLDTRAPELRASGAVNPVAPRAAHLSLRTQF